MSIGHEKLDVYRLSIRYVAWVYTCAGTLDGIHRHARDQWLRASQSIPLNIAEGNGKSSEADRRRFFEIARGSVLECAPIQDVLEVTGKLANEENSERKHDLNRMAMMLSRLGGRGWETEETAAEYGSLESRNTSTFRQPECGDFDFDFDFDLDSEDRVVDGEAIP